jgi:drug/metabolite transporter (DMT)-like permease
MTSADEHSRAGLWIFFYFAANLLLTLHNKWVLSSLHFNFPWTLTALHISVSGIGSYLLLVFLYRLQPSELDRTAWIKLLLFSALYAANIAISNVSLAYVSLAFHQLVRSATPAFTVALELVLFRKTRSVRIYCALLPVVLGICLATIDEFSDISFTVTGLCLTLLGVLLSCVKGIVTNIFMVGPLRLHPLDLIWRMALPSVLQCLMYGAIFGELQALPGFFKINDAIGSTFNTAVVDKLLINGLLALWLNWVSFTANKKTSALTMTVAGNIKQALSVVLAIYIFDSRITSLNFIGVVIALSGGAWYRYFSVLRRY